MYNHPTYRLRQLTYKRLEPVNHTNTVYAQNKPPVGQIQGVDRTATDYHTGCLSGNGFNRLVR